ALEDGGPGNLCLDVFLHGRRLDAVLGQYLLELLTGHAHAAAHLGKLLFDVGFGDVDAEAFGDLDLQLVVDDVIDQLLASRALAHHELNKLPALLDVEVGNRVAVDKEHDLGPRRRHKRQQCNDRGWHESACPTPDRAAHTDRFTRALRFATSRTIDT